MEANELVEHAKRISGSLLTAARSDESREFEGAFAQASEFLRQYAGEKNSFYQDMRKLADKVPSYAGPRAAGILNAFIQYVQAGLTAEISPERRAQLDVVSDLLEQAHRLLETSTVHPAAPAVLIGATLEEFLRNWVEDQGLDLRSRKPGIESYSSLLREAELITKQDAKDITSWAGIRNHAAHGEWEEVNDKKRVGLMLEGVNLFMRKYGM